MEYKAVDQKTMFGGSGLDPSKRTRNRQRRKAQRYAQRSRNKKDESGSKSSEGEADLKGEQVFGEPQKVRAVGLCFPGRPLSTGYREYAGVDALGRGLVANAVEILQADVAPQSIRPDESRTSYPMYSGRSGATRTASSHAGHLKSLEAQVSGLSWTSAQRLKLLPSDTATLSSVRRFAPPRSSVQKLRLIKVGPGGRREQGEKATKEKEKGRRRERTRPRRSAGPVTDEKMARGNSEDYAGRESCVGDRKRRGKSPVERD